MIEMDIVRVWQGYARLKNTAVGKKWRNKQRESAAAGVVIRESLQEHGNMIRCASIRRRIIHVEYE
jgi:hypothetical protein